MGGYTEADIKRWLSGFLARVEKQATAKNALQRICKAGLGRAAWICLWYYATADVAPAGEQQSLLDQAVDAAKRMIPPLQRAEYAQEQADTKLRELFERRAELKRADALTAPWAFPGAETIGEAARKSPAVAKALASGEASHLFATAHEGLRKHGALVMLAVLQAGADSYGVHLGRDTLAALGRCADPGRGLDEADLGRLLRGADMRQAAPGYVQLFRAVV